MQPWFPYRLTGAIIAQADDNINWEPWFPYRLTGAIMGLCNDAAA